MKALAVELSKRSRAGAPRGSPGVPVDARTAECGGRPTSCAFAIKAAPRSADQLQSTRESPVRPSDSDWRHAGLAAVTPSHAELTFAELLTGEAGLAQG